MKRSAYSIFVLIANGLAACTGPANVPDSSGNRTATYEPGEPNFDMEAAASVDGDETGIDIFVSIPAASMVFVSDDGQFRAGYELFASIARRSTKERVVDEAWTDSVVVDSYGATQAFRPLLRIERVAVPPGSYEVEITLEDRESLSTAVRRQVVDVVQPGAEQTAISEILLHALWDGGSFEPAVSLQIPSGYDSLRAVTELYNVPDRSDVKFTLVRFATDTTVASPPYWYTPAPFTLEYMGIDYGVADTIQTSRRVILNAGEQFGIEFDLPTLEKGTYMAAVEVPGAEGPVVKRRYFAIKGPTFPRITSLYEMVTALVYIAREDEMRALLSASSPEEMKSRFDAFWAERVPNKQAAASLLASYYERVEEANILFSNQKEGWKTDRGMIYVVFGYPAYVDNRFTRRDWYYFEHGSLLSRRLPPFIFKRSMAYGFAGLFESYVLQRAEVYEDVWRRKVEDWRAGTAL